MDSTDKRPNISDEDYDYIVNRLTKWMNEIDNSKLDKNVKLSNLSIIFGAIACLGEPKHSYSLEEIIINCKKLRESIKYEKDKECIKDQRYEEAIAQMFHEKPIRPELTPENKKTTKNRVCLFYKDDDRYVIHPEIRKIIQMNFNKNDSNIENCDLINGIQYKNGVSVKEGWRIEVDYEIIYRNPAIVQKIKEEKEYTCECCGFYSEYKVIDVHHIKPLSVIGREHETTKDDLLVLCPNCHRIAHCLLKKDIKFRNKDMLINELKKTNPL